MSIRKNSPGLIVFLCCAAIFCTTFLRADSGPTIISYQSQPQKIRDSDFIKRLIALPEWKPFWEAFTKKVDKELTRELTNRNKLEKTLPKEVVDHIQQGIEKNGISIGKAVDNFFNHVEAIYFELQGDADKDDIDENLNDLAKLLSGRAKEIELDFDGVLAFVLDVNPRPWLSMLKGFREGRDYKFIRNEADGDFILDFDFEIRDREISFCCAGIKLSGEKERYALIFSDEDDIARHCDSIKSGALQKKISAEPLEELVLHETCFLFLEHQRKKNDWNKDHSEVFSKIKSVRWAFRDVNGVSQIEAEATTQNDDEAKALRDVFNGLIALVLFSQGSDSDEEARQVVQWIKSIRLEQNGSRVSAVAKLDQPDAWKFVATILRKATDEIHRSASK